jgi:tetratricopeptide (TPR) repeat protein
MALNMNMNYAEAYCGRATVNAELHNYHKAIFDYSMAIKINPDFAEAYSNRADIYLHFKEYGLAMKDYDMAIKINPALRLKDEYFDSQNGKENQNYREPDDEYDGY